MKISHAQDPYRRFFRDAGRRRKTRAGFTKSNGTGETRTRRKTAKASRRRNRHN